ncbi:hypothetical protein J6590_070409 [Homalodisca vitripennis]|nr:hypothetical protein J6590_070409 [Homalodisca vitripennis]
MGTADVREAPRMRSECRARRMRSHRTRQVYLCRNAYANILPGFTARYKCVREERDMTEYTRDTSPWNLDRRQHLPTTFPAWNVLEYHGGSNKDLRAEGGCLHLSPSRLFPIRNANIDFFVSVPSTFPFAGVPCVCAFEFSCS